MSEKDREVHIAMNRLTFLYDHVCYPLNCLHNIYLEKKAVFTELSQDQIAGFFLIHSESSFSTSSINQVATSAL